MIGSNSVAIFSIAQGVTDWGKLKTGSGAMTYLPRPA